MRPWLAGLFLFLIADAAALGLPPGLSATEQVTAVAILDGETLALADGRQLRLLGLLGAKAPTADDEMQNAARALLERLAVRQALTLAFDMRRSDRYGRVLAHAVNERGEWLQAELLRAGFARVATTADGRAGAAEMLALEDDARRARRGLWAHSAWRVRDAATISVREADSFQIVAGTVREVATVKGRTYLNFGDDWQRDFTIAIAPNVTRMCRAAGLDPAALAGKSLRVRGWIKSQNGPLIELTHPEQIEVLP